MTNARLKKITTILLFISVTTLNAYAQDVPSDELPPGMKEKAVVLYITARIIESNKEIVWDASNSKITIPGRAVSLKLTGNNIVIVGQFTPYIRADGYKFLVAQGQVWIDEPGKGVHYYTNMQTMPLEYGEQILFFPLGTQKHEDGTRIEIQLVLRPYTGNEEHTQSQNPPPKENSH